LIQQALGTQIDQFVTQQDDDKLFVDFHKIAEYLSSEKGYEFLLSIM
jgi:hypothetical protein